MWVVLLRSSAAISCSTARLSGMVPTIGHCQIMGSPSKYICVTSLCAKAWPNTEKWMWAGRQSLTRLGQG